LAEVAVQQGKINMKIAQIVCVYPPYRSGIGTSAENFARLLKLGGNEVETFTLDYGLEAPPQEGVSRLKPILKFGNGGLLLQLFGRLKYFDCVYLHYPFFGALEIIWFLKKFIWKNRKKLVIHYHMDAVLPSPLARFLGAPAKLVFKSLFRQADLIISASLDYVKSGDLAGFYRNNQNKFAEMPFGVDIKRFKPSAAPLSGNRTPRILFVGGLDRAHYFKGLEILLAAVAGLKKDQIDFVLDVVGSGDLRNRYAAKAVELGIAGKVNFFGGVSAEDLPEKYRAADIFVLPSINKGEAFGIVLLEALASGLPVIASDLPGVRGVFTSACGLKFKPGDAGDLKEKIKALIVDHEKKKKMGKAARLLAAEKYGWDKVGERLNELLSAR
jgi:glycosyltransferase involved in cell wall biosynthesis